VRRREFDDAEHGQARDETTTQSRPTVHAHRRAYPRPDRAADRDYGETLGGEIDWAPGDVRTVIIELCRDRPSIAEISSYAAMPIGVIRVLVGDLVESGHLCVHATLTDRSTVADRRRLIERTLDGLRGL